MTMVVSRIVSSDLETITRDAYKDLERIVNSQVVLVGATGFIGTWLSLSFLHARQTMSGTGSIVLTSRNTSKLQKLIEHFGFTQGYCFLESDVRTFPEGLISEASFVINAATPARASVNKQAPLEMIDIIVAGQRRLLELSALNKSIRFLFLSSGAVYGPQPFSLEKISEDWLGGPDPTDPGSAYHEGKRLAEILGFIYGRDSSIDFISARLFAFLAPYLPLDEHFAAGNFLRDAVTTGQIKIQSGGSSIRSYQYSTDLCTQLWAVLNRGKPQNAYNIGSEEEVTISQLARLIANFTSSEVRILGADTPMNLSRYVPDVKKIKELMFEEKDVSLEVAIQRTLAWISESSTGL